MKEFMFYIRNEKEAKNSLTAEQHLAFIKKCEDYIGILKNKNRLIAAQPLIREGVVISKTNEEWEEKNIEKDTEVQVGYYHILASDIDEAIRIAKDNPEFEYVSSASIEVRPIKTKETETGFVYPKS
ncbi:YciI family protein [Flavobacterium aestivum]|uniref:YciI family protein n=1 Tax=Flavobacterium aestivum TaxID=3003257 RepID=UPI002285C699|nr:YciI family protein [Flavobacterium aestivum]